MFTFCDVLHETKQKKHKQTLESMQYGLEIIFNGNKKSASLQKSSVPYS